MKNTAPNKNRWMRVTVVAIACLGALLAFSLAACAPRTASSSASEEDAPQQDVSFTWSKDSDCAMCHENAAASFTDSACMASNMADLQTSCMTCHTDEAGLSEAHAKVTLESEKKRPTLKKTEIESAVCESCHDKAAIAEKTADSTVLTDANGTVVNPHDIPVHEDHEKAGIECASCHKVHSSETPAETAPPVCTNCHHHKVYECGTCHT